MVNKDSVKYQPSPLRLTLRICIILIDVLVFYSSLRLFGFLYISLWSGIIFTFVVFILLEMNL